ncbi:MAG: response regulator transcription factor [Ardenticatenaceae bacterium]|nr:response regulator transcription factor [Ardenticatenaceae bacterium]HBY92763.1 DNA-binding response regulator [Chloroflexota bacterium]
MNKPRVLVVDDEPPTVKLLSANLKARGYDVLAAYDGLEALKLARENLLDLIVLDLGLPGMDGFAVCEAVRHESQVPVIVLSARGREKDKVRALDLGADDYLTKPFSVEELLARVRAVLRRTAPAETIARTAYAAGDLVVDFESRRVTLNEEPVELTPIEYRLLAHLALNAGKVLTYRALLQAVWGPEYGDEKEYVWTYIRRLRQKLGEDQDQPRYLLTEPGVGYRLAAS